MLQTAIRVIIVLRKSNDPIVPRALAVECRLFEPMEFMQRNSDRIRWTAMSEEELIHCDHIEADLIWFNKHLTDEAIRIAQKAKAQGCVVFFDLDDWVLKYPLYSGVQLPPGSVENFRTFMALADEVTVANDRLLLETHLYRKNAELVTNGFYLDKYWGNTTSPSSELKNIVITNAGHLKLDLFKAEFIRVLDRFFDKFPDWSLDYYGEIPKELETKPFINHKGYYSYTMHKQMLLNGKYAFAIIPLGGIEDEDSYLFHACKNPVKYLDYAGLGIPGIYSRVPVYESCIVPERTGILVPNYFADWLSALERMACNKALRNTLRTNGFDDVKNNHHIRYSANRMELLMRKYFD